MRIGRLRLRDKALRSARASSNVPAAPPVRAPSLAPPTSAQSMSDQWQYRFSRSSRPLPLRRESDAPQVQIALADPPPLNPLLFPAELPTATVETERIFSQANGVAKSGRFGKTDQELRDMGLDEGMVLRTRVEERELLRQFEAEQIIARQRAQWNLHPVHYVKRWDTRVDRWGEDIVSYSQERLEKQTTEFLIQDHAYRQKLEHQFESFGWAKESLWALMKAWYRFLPEPRRFFTSEPYYQSMRPRPRGVPGASSPRTLRRASRLQVLMRRRRVPVTIYEERHSHKVIRDAMQCGALPFVRLPKPPLIWDHMVKDAVIADGIDGRQDLVLERRQGAILLRRWLSNGQKISCEVIGAHYLTKVRNPTPLDVDWDRVAAEGGFLLHKNMVNSVDHPNNFAIVTDLSDAVRMLCQFEPHPGVEFDPRDFRFWPYLFVNDPSFFGLKPQQLRAPAVESTWRAWCAWKGSEPARLSSATPLEGPE